MMTTELSRKMLAGVLASAALAAAAASDHTVSVTEKVDLAASPEQAWDAIKDFQGWQKWHPAFAQTQLVSGVPNGVGSVRLLSAKDGAKFTEELVTRDADLRMVQYRIMESPAPVVGYVSTLHVQPHGTGSTVVWNSTFKVKEGTPEADARKGIAGIYRLGLDNLATMQRGK
jgi:hypothetical protein